jgi:hypothetical protein
LKERADIQVLSNWDAYSKLMEQGRRSFANVFIMYLSTGCIATLARRYLERTRRSMDLIEPEKENITNPPQWTVRRLLRSPLVLFTLFLLFGSLLLPGQPWKHMRTTLLFDAVSTISSVFVTKTLRDMQNDCTVAGLGADPLGNLNYNPGDDPYYISNLDSPIDEFIEDALEGLQFTNIVHIVLESMRADSYPFKEESLLMTFAKDTYGPRSDAKPATTSNVSPFIASLAEHTISWETVWSTIPFTHKAMLGRISCFL